MEKQIKGYFTKKLNRTESLSEYIKGETTTSLARRLKVKPSEIVKLNSNENFFIPRKRLFSFLLQVAEECDLRIYPQEEESDFKSSLSKYLGLSPNQLVIGCGGDQLIDLVVRIFLGKDDAAISIAPTFFMYQHSVNLQGSKYIEVPLKDDFSLDSKQIFAKTTAKTSLLFLCSPNNPTANQFKIEDIRSLAEGFKGLVVIDEAYVEFADYSIISLVEELDNLIVLRTFSKAFGLASLRLGYAISNPNIAKTMTKAQMPYSVSSIALRIASRLLETTELIETGVEELKKERSRLLNELNKIQAVTAFDSQTNFVLFKTKNHSNNVFNLLLEHGILIKKLGQVLKFENCLRTTVGLPEMNDKLLSVLKQQ